MSNYSDELKAQVMAALLAGQSLNKVAGEYKLPKSTVQGWRKQADAIRSTGGATSESIDAKLLEYLGKSITALCIQAEHFGDKGWLTKQSAEQLAVLHGVQTDKIIRLLEAFERGASGNSNS